MPAVYEWDEAKNRENIAKQGSISPTPAGSSIGACWSAWTTARIMERSAGSPLVNSMESSLKANGRERKVYQEAVGGTP
jgi:hypothetical protein